MAGFYGRYEHSVYGKGRVILPAKFRSSFEQGGFLTQYLDGCLALWRAEDFEAQTREMQERARTSRSWRNLARLWASATCDLDLDRQGRTVIPAALRTYAALDTDVLVLGAIDRVELWNPDRWQDKVAPEERLLTEGTDD